ncbi:hypothetical protein chiPu_0015092 [Chiloscyllium punctatum]|uniref:Uncharacterized protein n=1 Tax=Chiloscyllium punctatum TaxID=137246 RepID=A0A401T1W6_CHIPU|nr:hypothetical protein [Chiloscyllium punctatum]
MADYLPRPLCGAESPLSVGKGAQCAGAAAGSALSMLSPSHGDSLKKSGRFGRRKKTVRQGKTGDRGIEAYGSE